MELIDYVRVLRRNWLLVLLVTVVCGGTSFAYSSTQPLSYSTVTRLVVTDPTAARATDEATPRRLAAERAVAFTAYANTAPALDAALTAARYNPAGVRPAVLATADGLAPFITIVVTDRDPVRAAAVANAYVSTLTDVVVRFGKLSPRAAPGLSVLEAAGVPTAPVSPKPFRDGAAGLALGLLLGLSLAFLRAALDRTVKDVDELAAALAVPILGVIPQELNGVDLPSRGHPTSGRAEAYRSLRVNLQLGGLAPSPARIVITSALQGEGKTTTAANLATAFARAGQPIVIIDADLRRPRLAAVFTLRDAGPGLSGVLADTASVGDALRLVEPNLFVLPAGPAATNPSDLLSSPRLATLLQELGERFAVVLIDSPPVLPVADSLLLTAQATGVIVVTRLGSTTSELAQRTLAALRRLEVPLLGIVANGARPTAMGGYSRYRRGYLSTLYGTSVKASTGGARHRTGRTALPAQRHHG